MKRLRTVLASAAIVVASTVSLGTSASAEGLYDRKPLNVFINFGVGGNTDIIARSLLSHMVRHLPGEPRVVFYNKPGAAGIVGINYFGSAVPNDGYSIGVFAVTLMTEIIGDEALTVYYGDFDFIGSILEDFIFHIRTSDDLKEPTDIFSLDGPIKSAGHGPAGAKDLMLRASLDLLGVEYENVTGYRSAGDIRAALLKGDVDMTADTMTGYVSRVVPNLVETGQSTPLYSLGVPAEDGTMQRAPGSPADIPTFDEFYEAQFGMKPSGPEYDILRLIGQIRENGARAVVIPKGAPEEIVTMLRDAFAATLEDPLFQEDFAKIAGFVPVGLSGPDAQAKFNALMDSDAETIEFLKAYSEKTRR